MWITTQALFVAINKRPASCTLLSKSTSEKVSKINVSINFYVETGKSGSVFNYFV